MRRANVQLAADRRSEILAAAQTCFARSGFHQTSMQEICAEAGMSPGNLYRYFRSKEEIIAGIAERDRAETAQNFAAVSAENFFDGLAALAQQHLVERSLEEVALCAEIMAESRRNPAVARIYQDIEADVRARFIELLQERGRARRDPPRHRPERHRDGAVRARRRPVVAARRRAVVQRRSRDADRAAHGRTVARAGCQRQQDRGTVMKGARIAAVGLVVGAAAWIASGHLFPHETAESRAAVQPEAKQQQKLFRVSVIDSRVEPRTRNLVLSGRTEADKKMMLMARADGTIAELKVRRGSVVKQGDVIAILSDEAREARVLQARAMLMQRKTELAAKMKLVEQGSMPKLEAVNLETQFKAAEAGLPPRRPRRTAASFGRPGRASSTTSRSKSDKPCCR